MCHLGTRLAIAVLYGTFGNHTNAPFTESHDMTAICSAISGYDKEQFANILPPIFLVYSAFIILFSYFYRLSTMINKIVITQ